MIFIQIKTDLSTKKSDPKILTPDRDSWARYLVRSLEQKTDNWISRTVYVAPFKGKNCTEEFGTYLSGWLRPALAESSIMIPLDQSSQLYNTPISTLRTRSSRGITKVKVNNLDQPSFTADLLIADTELKDEYFLHGEIKSTHVSQSNYWGPYANPWDLQQKKQGHQSSGAFDKSGPTSRIREPLSP